MNAPLPHLLHLDKASRRQFAASLYGGASTFVAYGMCDAEKLYDQVAALHMRLIRELRVMSMNGDVVHTSEMEAAKACMRDYFGANIDKALVFPRNSDSDGDVAMLDGGWLCSTCSRPISQRLAEEVTKRSKDVLWTVEELTGNPTQVNIAGRQAQETSTRQDEKGQ